jgi:DnaJ-class molecular chaperone
MNTEQTQDPYEILHISKTATQEEIREAYKEAAKKHHPDRGGETIHFQAIQKAYECLSNPEHREHYDRFGNDEDWVGGVGGGGVGGGVGGIFRSMRSAGFKFSSLFGVNPNRSIKGRNKYHAIGLSLSELYHGKQFSFTLQREILCKQCKGKGRFMDTCSECGGSGHSQRQKMFGGMFATVFSSCNNCKGAGEQPRDKGGDCESCNTQGTFNQESTLQVHIPPGTTIGKEIRFEEHCSESLEYTTPGDVILVVHGLPSDLQRGWTHTKNDLQFTVTLTFAESLLGWTRVLSDHPSGSPLRIVCRDRITHHGTLLCVKGYGMPSNISGSKGDLFLKCVVETLVMTPEQQEVIRSLFGSEPLEPSYPDEIRPEHP